MTDGRWKLTHHLFGGGGRERYPDGPTPVFALKKQLQELPADSLARKLAHRCEIPPVYELYDLQNDANEFHNLIGDPGYSQVEKRLKRQLESWRQQSSDPFLDDDFVDHFTASYRKNYELWKSLGGSKMRDEKALDFEEFIPPWDPTPYLGNHDH